MRDTDLRSHLLPAFFLRAAGRHQAAIDALRAHLGGQAVFDRKDVGTRHLLGVWLADAGQLEEARAILLDLLRLSGRLAPEALNVSVRRLAKETGFEVRDTARAISAAAEAKGRLPGFADFTDQCHLRPARVAADARAILEMVVDAPRLRGPLPMPQPGCGGLVQFCGDPYGPCRFDLLAPLLSYWLREGGPTASDDLVEVFAPFAEVAPPAPDAGRVLVAVGRAFGDNGQPLRAVEWLDRARRLGGADAALWSAIYQAALGRPDAALTEIERARLDGPPNDPRPDILEKLVRAEL